MSRTYLQGEEYVGCRKPGPNTFVLEENTISMTLWQTIPTSSPYALPFEMLHDEAKSKNRDFRERELMSWGSGSNSNKSNKRLVLPTKYYSKIPLTIGNQYV
jgi:hypothetical protein